MYSTYILGLLFILDFLRGDLSIVDILSLMVKTRERAGLPHGSWIYQ